MNFSFPGESTVLDLLFRLTTSLSQLEHLRELCLKEKRSTTDLDQLITWNEHLIRVQRDEYKEVFTLFYHHHHHHHHVASVLLAPGPG